MEVANRLSAVTVKVSDLITLVRDNRATHRNVFEEALAGFRLAANRALNERIDEIANREIVSLVFTLPIPEDHTDDYSRVLTMLEMTLAAGQELITLDSSEQAQFVMDDWAWKRAFGETSTFYGKGGS